MIEDIDLVLSEYPGAVQSHQYVDKGLVPCLSIKRVENQIQDLLGRTIEDPLLVKSSIGITSWAPAPWIAILDPRHTRSTQDFFYPCLLFKADGSGVYLSLQVATGRRFGTPNRSQIKMISERAKRFRDWFSSSQLESVGLGHDSDLDLAVQKGVGVGYTHGSIVHKYYDGNLLPPELELEFDILTLSREYVEFCSRDDARELFLDLAITEAEQIETLNSGNSGRGQGFVQDSQIRKLVEEFAVEKAIKYFGENGWRVDPSPQKNRPYDLSCEKNESTLHVEVKGTRTTGEQVVLTRGEVRHVDGRPEQTALFVVSEIRVKPGQNGSFELSGGTARLWDTWDLDHARLTPISFDYRPNFQTCEIVEI